MRYLYFKSDKGNFGDDLNEWLWPQIFGLGDSQDKDVLLGIGSILSNNIDLIKNIRSDNKIVFGSGIRPQYNSFKVDKTWDIRFLRGPLSSFVLQNKYEFITDAAYALRQLDGFPQFEKMEKKYEVSLMPYFKSVPFFDWKGLCAELGFNYISPFSEQGVVHTLTEIAKSKHIISEAMHGAIISDILRIPWSRFVLTTPFTEGSHVSEFKWMDWMTSVQLGNIESTHIDFYTKTPLKKWSNGLVNIDYLKKEQIKSQILKSLSKTTNYYLSDNSIIEILDNKIYESIETLKVEKNISNVKI